jgi:hypothetical protein
VQKGLERVLESIDPTALKRVLRVEEDDEPRTEVTQAVVAFDPEGSSELLALRKLVAAHERELERLRKENTQLKNTVRQLQTR